MKREKLKSLIIFFALMIIIAIFLLFFKKQIYHIFSILIKGSNELKNYVNSLGFLGKIIIIFLQMLQVIITVFPSEPIMIIAGVSYGPFMGSVFCAIGVILGNQFIYFAINNFNNIFNNPKKIAKRKILEEKIARSNRKIGWMIYILYVIPAVPFGLIAIIGVTSKIKWWKYTLITSLGCLTPIFFTVFVGNALVSFSPKATLIMFLVIIIIVMFVLLNKGKIINIIFRDPSLTKRLENMEIKKPNKLVYAFFYFIFKRKAIKKNKVNIIDNVNVKSLKGPFIVLSNHPSRIDFLYVGCAFYPHRLNFITDYYMFRIRGLNLFLRLFRAIPKQLFQPDKLCVKYMLKVIKRGGNLCIFPEGILSSNGSEQSLQPATAKFLYKMRLPVINCQIDGAYLTRPKYSKTNKIGRVDMQINQLLKEEDYDRLTVEEIEGILYKTIKYNDFTWQEENKVDYIGDDKAQNLNGILYICPKCKKEFTLLSAGNDIYCTECNLKASLNNKYQFIYPEGDYFKNINQWYQYQREIARENIKNSKYQLKTNVIIKRLREKLRFDPEIYAGEGVMILDRSGLTYHGTMFKENITLHIPSLSLPSMSYAAGRYFELYYEGIYYAFYPEKGIQSIKYVITAEEYFKLNHQGENIYE